MLSSGLMARVFEAFRRRAGGWPGGLSEGRECRALAADSPYRFVFFRREAPDFGLWGWDVRWCRGPVPEGGRYGKGQGGGFLSSERPGAEL